MSHRCAVGYHAAPFVADGGRVEPNADCVRFFLAADGFRRDAHLDIRREAQRQTRPRRRSKLHVAASAHARTDACRLDGRPLEVLIGFYDRGSLKLTQSWSKTSKTLVWTVRKSLLLQLEHAGVAPRRHRDHRER